MANNADQLASSEFVCVEVLWPSQPNGVMSLLQKPTDLDLHCSQRQDTSRFSRTRVKIIDLDNRSIQEVTLSLHQNIFYG